MRIIKSNVIMDGEYRNILVKESASNYPGLDSLSSPENIVRVMNDVFNMENRAEEYVYLLAMTAKCRPVSFFEVSHGTCDSSVVGAREVMVRALLCCAANIVLVHNHPSGSPSPSQQDLQVTKSLKEASELLGIHFCDHIIIGRDGFFSFRESGLVL